MFFFKDIIYKKYFVRNYLGLTAYHWNRISEASMKLSDHGIIPKLIEMGDLGNLKYMKYRNADKLESISGYERNIEILVKKMHSIDYSHGNLTKDNIGLDFNDSIVFLNHEYSYKISLGIEQGGNQWLKKRISNESFDEFVNLDFNLWKK